MKKGMLVLLLATAVSVTACGQPQQSGTDAPASSAESEAVETPEDDGTDLKTAEIQPSKSDGVYYGIVSMSIPIEDISPEDLSYFAINRADPFLEDGMFKYIIISDDVDDTLGSFKYTSQSYEYDLKGEWVGSYYVEDDGSISYWEWDEAGENLSQVW